MFSFFMKKNSSKTITPPVNGDQENVLIPFIKHYFPFYSISKPEWAFDPNRFVVGWGHSSNKKSFFAGIDEDSAHLLLSSDLAAIDIWLRKKTGLKKSWKKNSIDVNQWNAMILLVFIIGRKNFLSSRLFGQMLVGERVFDSSIITDEWAELDFRDSPPKLLEKMLLTVEEYLVYNRLLVGLVTSPEQAELEFFFPFSEAAKSHCLLPKNSGCR